MKHWQIIFFSLMSIEAAKAVTCTGDGNTSGTVAGYLAPDIAYATPMPYVGRDWEVSAFHIKYQRGIGGSYQVALVKMSTSPLATTEILGQCTSSVPSGGTTGTYRISNCNPATPIKVRLSNSTTEQIGIQIKTNSSNLIVYTDTSNSVSTSEAYSVSPMVALATTTGAARPYFEITYQPLFLSKPTSTNPELTWSNTTAHVGHSAGASHRSSLSTTCYSSGVGSSSVQFDPIDKVLKRFGP